jgi:hypothetical protein
MRSGYAKTREGIKQDGQNEQAFVYETRDHQVQSTLNGLKLRLVILIMYICFKCYEDGLKLQLVVLIM